MTASLQVQSECRQGPTNWVDIARAPGVPEPEKLPPLLRLLHDLSASSLIIPEDLDRVPADVQEELGRGRSADLVLETLVSYGVLTEYQAARILAGTTRGLVVGNYRVLDRVGAGAMGVVFKAEHRYLRRVVAIKVLPVSHEKDAKLLHRFYSEMQAVAQLQHPNIVAALDAGESASPERGAPVLHYFVMEYVPGEDLEEHVDKHGPLPVIKACDLIHQVASALVEAHKHALVHRDIKPSNVRITPDEQAKLLDFGLARLFGRRQTQPGTVLGTLDYMSPEQARDASAVDIRTDIYGLGGTLFWCLTRQPPFPQEGNMIQELTRRLTQPPPSVRALRPDVPANLDAVIARMMAINPDDRYASPQLVMQALLPFLRPEMREDRVLSRSASAAEQRLSAAAGGNGLQGHRILVVDDEPGIRKFCRFTLEPDGLLCDEAENGMAGLEAVDARPYDLVLLDIKMPCLSGLEVLQRLRSDAARANLKVVMFSGHATADEMAQTLVAGADGYLTKPFSVVQLTGQVKAALRLKDAQDSRDLLNNRLLDVNAELEKSLGERDSDLVHARNALILALAKLTGHRDGETGKHGLRLQRYSRCLAEAACSEPAFAGQVDARYVEAVECCAPLHDIGKVGLPDYILLKPGKLTLDERVLMQAHTQIGADLLAEVARHHGSALAFLQTAIDICRHHHERYDGTGYPNQLAGNAIPLSARMVAICDVYDALRSRRVYKPALSHAATFQLMTEGSRGQFDPGLLDVFRRCAADFERTFRELTDS